MIQAGIKVDYNAMLGGELGNSPSLCLDRYTMTHFKQGLHDGLCGFYAALNAIRSFAGDANPPLNDIDAQTIFDEAVECLFRVPGCDLRILKGDPAIGGIDALQVRDLCALLSDRFDLPLTIKLSRPVEKRPFAARYRAYCAEGNRFAFVVPYRDDSHWVTALPYDRHSYRLIDNGRALVTPLRGGDGPRLATHSVVELKLNCGS
jgi:hypothetical protein